MKNIISDRYQYEEMIKYINSEENRERLIFKTKLKL